MKLGINAQRASDLACLLKTTTVQARNVRKGDVIWDDHNLWVVVGVETTDEGLVLKEADGNDAVYPPDTQKFEVTIIDRKILKGAKKR